jgi:hypothetical protein
MQQGQQQQQQVPQLLSGQQQENLVWQQGGHPVPVRA